MTTLRLLGSGQPSPEMAKVWRDHSFLTSLAQIERAWVAAAVAHGHAAPSVVGEINRGIQRLLTNPSGVIEQVAEVGRPVAPLVDALAKGASLDLQKVLHLGLTTQDVLDGALTLLRKAAFGILEDKVGSIVQRLGGMADQNRDTLMIARSNGQMAAPTTFGLFLAEASGEIRRGRARCTSRHVDTQTLMLNGAVGLSDPFGADCEAIRTTTAQDLGLTYDPARTAAPRDQIADLHLALGLLSKSFGRIARTIAALQSDGINELSERNPAPSSAMPQKKNPRLAERVVLLSDQIDGHVQASLNATQTLHHRSGESWMLEWSAMQGMFETLDAQVTLFARLLEQTDIHKDQMRSHVEGALISVQSDRLLVALSRRIGRKAAKTTIAQILSDVEHSNDALHDLENALIEHELADVVAETSIAAVLEHANAKQTLLG